MSAGRDQERAESERLRRRGLEAATHASKVAEKIARMDALYRERLTGSRVRITRGRTKPV